MSRNDNAKVSSTLPLFGRSGWGVRLLLGLILLLVIFVSCQSEIASEAGGLATVSFSLPDSTATRAQVAMAAGTTLRVVAYLRTDGNGAPEANRRGECTFKIESNGTLSLCAVNADGTVNAGGTPPKAMLLAPGKYNFITFSPALPVYHTSTNPMIAVNQGVDFSSAYTSQQTIVAGVNNIALWGMTRKCAQLKLKTDRYASLSGSITKIRVQNITLEEMTDEPVWVTGTGMLNMTGNTYTNTITVPGTDFSVLTGHQDYQQTAVVNILPFPARNFRIRASVLYNNDTTPTVLETTVNNTAFVAGTSTYLILYFGYNHIEVVAQDKWTDAPDTEGNFGVTNLTASLGNKTANCYIVNDNASSNYCFNVTKRGNGYESTVDANVAGINYNTLPALSTATSARVIWQTGNSATDLVVDPASVILKNGWVYFTTTGKVNEGNAVIGIFASNSDTAPCIWSWHIWKLNGATPAAVTCTKTPSPSTASPTFKMMALNLGAYNNNQGDPKSIGLYYQWGRKDPFPGPAQFADVELNNIYGKWNNYGAIGIWNGQYNAQIAETTSTIGTEAWAVKYPTTFIISPESSDWMFTQNNYLWGNPWVAAGSVEGFNGSQGIKSIYDPCPVGYRVPPQDTWNKQTGNGVFQNNGIIMNSVSTGIWFPAAGSRHYTSGTLWKLDRDTEGTYLSSSAYDTWLAIAASLMTFRGDGVVMPKYVSARATGFSVRCTAE